MRHLTLLLIVFWPSVSFAQDQLRQIVVSATGSVAAVPDMATVSFGVYREANTAAVAMATAGEATQDVLSALAAAGVDERDIATRSISLNPVWDQPGARPREARGYAASNSLEVRARDLGELGALIDTVLDAGANQMNGLRFGVSDADVLEQAARADAVRRAKQRAETLAEAAGITLGQVQTISEGAVGPAPMMRGAMMESSAVPIAAGEMDIQVTVSIVFSIE